MSYVALQIHFPRNAILAALLYSGFISSTILTTSIQKFSRIPLWCKNYVFLYDNQLRFPDYNKYANVLQKSHLAEDNDLSVHEIMILRGYAQLSSSKVLHFLVKKVNLYKCVVKNHLIF